ncbi:hypothetical protein JKP88DRAFT_265830 [Tribonema minus]|uniref:C2H2-type domain-containing protein n=1 Tax=Tribonema minus TaxID=303371 RepID=A0A835YH57_9STRA|nr:hypothetical protein JKP88DRAFT_265830 [Tribonema minus]
MLLTCCKYHRQAFETISVGQGTVVELEQQHDACLYLYSNFRAILPLSLNVNAESLQRSAMVVDSTQYLLDKSARVIRGMTMWGRMQNFFSDEPAPVLAASTPISNSTSSSAGMEGYICPECRMRCASADDLLAHFASLHEALHGNAHAEEPATISSREGAARNELFGEADKGRPGQGAWEQRSSTGCSANGADNRRNSGGSGSGLAQEQRNIMRSQQAMFVTSITLILTSAIAFICGGPPPEQAYIDTLSSTVLPQLQHVTQSLGTSLAEQEHTLDYLHDGADKASDRALAVTRQAAKMTRLKPTASGTVALLHCTSGAYLAAVGSEVTLKQRQIRNVCLWERHSTSGGICGFKSGVSGLWLGVGMLGGIQCSAATFKSWEQWQCDALAPGDPDESVRLICCAGGWGKGSYVKVDAEGQLSLAKCCPENKAEAAVFKLVSIREDQFRASPYVSAPRLQPATSAAKHNR